MLWDAAWDQQNVINGKAYSDHVADIMNSSSPVGSTISPTAPSTSAAPLTTLPLPPPTTGEGGSKGMLGRFSRKRFTVTKCILH